MFRRDTRSCGIVDFKRKSAELFARVQFIKFNEKTTTFLEAKLAIEAVPRDFGNMSDEFYAKAPLHLQTTDVRLKTDARPSSSCRSCVAVFLKHAQARKPPPSELVVLGSTN